MKAKIIAMLVALTLLMFSAGLANHYHGKYQRALQINAEQEKTLAERSRLIAVLETQDAQNRELMATQQRKEQLLRQQGQIYQRKLRDALKGDKCGNSPMPAAVIDLLRGTDTNPASADSPAPP